MFDEKFMNGEVASSDPDASYYFMRGVTACGVVICGIIAVTGLPGVYRASASKNWPTTQGVVTSSFAEPFTAFEKEDSEDESETAQHAIYYPKIEYTYSVDGKSYTSDRLGYARPFPKEEKQEALEVLTPYPVGSDVAVHYRPSSPDFALLNPGIDRAVLSRPIIGFVAAVLFYVANAMLPKFWKTKEG